MVQGDGGVTGDLEDELDEVELAVVAYRVGSAWELDDLPDESLLDVEAISRELTEYAATPALALVSVGEDFAVLVRRDGEQTRVVLSDRTAAEEWTLAGSVADLLDLADPEDDDEPAPAGDLGLLSDLGMSADDLAALVADEPHPDDLLLAVADELGFGDELEDALDDDSDDVDGYDDAGDSSDDEPDDDELGEDEDDEDDEGALGRLRGDDEEDFDVEDDGEEE